jgi:hypothetical protein
VTGFETGAGVPTGASMTGTSQQKSAVFCCIVGQRFAGNTPFAKASYKPPHAILPAIPVCTSSSS